MDEEGEKAEKPAKTRKKRAASREAIEQAFVSCPRCSFFLAQYRLLHQDFEKSAANNHGNWLLLTWSDSVAKLLQKSYGIEFDSTIYHYEGTCRECQRNFVFQAATPRRKQPAFRIEIKPT
jgi:hypothetical protein